MTTAVLICSKTSDLKERNDHWRVAVDVGLPDPRSKRLTRQSVPYLAKLFRVSEKTVERGIVESRQRQRLLEDVAIP